MFRYYKKAYLARLDRYEIERWDAMARLVEVAEPFLSGDDRAYVDDDRPQFLAKPHGDHHGRAPANTGRRRSSMTDRAYQHDDCNDENRDEKHRERVGRLGMPPAQMLGVSRPHVGEREMK